MGFPHSPTKLGQVHEGHLYKHSSAQLRLAGQSCVQELCGSEACFLTPDLLFDHVFLTVGYTIEGKKNSGVLFSVIGTHLFRRLLDTCKAGKPGTKFPASEAVCLHLLGRGVCELSVRVWIWYLIWKGCTSQDFQSRRWELLDSGLREKRRTLKQEGLDISTPTTACTPKKSKQTTPSPQIIARHGHELGKERGKIQQCKLHGN